MTEKMKGKRWFCKKYVIFVPLSSLCRHGTGRALQAFSLPESIVSMNIKCFLPIFITCIFLLSGALFTSCEDYDEEKYEFTNSYTIDNGEELPIRGAFINKKYLPNYRIELMVDPERYQEPFARRFIIHLDAEKHSNKLVDLSKADVEQGLPWLVSYYTGVGQEVWYARGDPYSAYLLAPGSTVTIHPIPGSEYTYEVRFVFLFKLLDGTPHIVKGNYQGQMTLVD